jgi:hypothetical protein
MHCKSKGLDTIIVNVLSFLSRDCNILRSADPIALPQRKAIAGPTIQAVSRQSLFIITVYFQCRGARYDYARPNVCSWTQHQL